jgi:hypothetical protein
VPSLFRSCSCENMPCCPFLQIGCQGASSTDPCGRRDRISCASARYCRHPAGIIRDHAIRQPRHHFIRIANSTALSETRSNNVSPEGPASVLQRRISARDTMPTGLGSDQRVDRICAGVAAPMHRDCDNPPCRMVSQKSLNLRHLLRPTHATQQVSGDLRQAGRNAGRGAVANEFSATSQSYQ